jgi:starch phosphorylase
MAGNAPQQNRHLIDALNELALDLRWSWSHGTDEIWKRLDPVLWDLTHNAFIVLQTISEDKINELFEDESVRRRIEEFLANKREALVTPGWFQLTYPNSSLTHAAFFSMEFMLSEALPIYSGGLGNVAGDHLKSASDLGVPVVGVGLLYQQGYARQMINRDGSQQTFLPYNDPGQLPVTPLRTASGEWLRIEIKLPGYSLWLRSWKVQVGRVMLLLLDSNDAANFPVHRGITTELYGAGAEIRLMQELILGIGGWRLLKALGMKPEICHLNEGHSAFVILERTLDFMIEKDQSFEVALTVTRSGNIFTTHTAIGAGFDSFSPGLIEQYLGAYAKEMLKISLHELLSLGRQNADDVSEGFNTSYLAIRGSAHINGVSKLHGAVSRRLFGPLFPRWPIAEVPVGHVTNGVHMPTWDSPEADKVWTEAGGKSRWLGKLEELEKNIRLISDARLWTMHNLTQQTFIAYIRKRYSRQLAVTGAPMKAVEESKHLLDPNVLTLGFARRFVAYKRPNLLLQNRERFRKILTDPHRPVQLVIAGKAHPGDLVGQAMIQQWVHFINRYDLQNHIVFLADYDMLLTEHLVQGVDVWVNTPQRPWEACGTSGMKVLVNGGINLSVLDGWWDEGYTREVGWAIGDGNNGEGNPSTDAVEAAHLYDLLENQIAPEFYSRDENGIPVKWVNRMRESMARLTPRFSANRSVREYTEEYYLPAASAYRKRADKNGEVGIQIVNWKHAFEKKWEKLRFGEMTVDSSELHCFSVQVYLHDFVPGEIKVELYAEGVNGRSSEKYEMDYKGSLQKGSPISLYNVSISSTRAISDYTARIIPTLENVSVPLECSCILWQR